MGQFTFSQLICPKCGKRKQLLKKSGMCRKCKIDENKNRYLDKEIEFMDKLLANANSTQEGD